MLFKYFVFLSLLVLLPLLLSFTSFRFGIYMGFFLVLEWDIKRCTIIVQLILYLLCSENRLLPVKTTLFLVGSFHLGFLLMFDTIYWKFWLMVIEFLLCSGTQNKYLLSGFRVKPMICVKMRKKLTIFLVCSFLQKIMDTNF